MSKGIQAGKWLPLAVAGGLAVLLAGTVLMQAQAPAKKKVLIFTKSSGFQHPIIKRYKDGLSDGEKMMAEIVSGLGMEPVCTKDGSVINAESLQQFAAVIFYTSGDLGTVAKPTPDGKADTGPAVTPQGKADLLAAVKNGLGFVGIHSAADTWHTVHPDHEGKAARYVALGSKNLDPYLAMLGAEFIAHDKAQDGTLVVTDAKFPGMKYEQPQARREKEEWYSLKDFAPDLHVLMLLDPAEMEGPHYERGPFPITWIRQDGKGRVFYTGLGHGRESWNDEAFRSLLAGGLRWVTGEVEADVTPNLDQVAPRHGEMPKQPPKKPTPSAPAP